MEYKTSEISENERKLCDIGRRIMDLAVDEKDCVLSNKMCVIGGELTSVGAPQGKPTTEFTIEEMAFIFKIIKDNPAQFPEFIE
jgi:hypothetical protein